MVLAVVDVGHGLVLQALGQLQQRSFSCRDTVSQLSSASLHTLTARGLTGFSSRLVFPVRLVQDVGAAAHPEVIVDLSEPPAGKGRGQTEPERTDTLVLLVSFGRTSSEWRFL